jgi:hypothetical protein
LASDCCTLSLIFVLSVHAVSAVMLTTATIDKVIHFLNMMSVSPSVNPLLL